MQPDIIGWGTPESEWQSWGGLDALPRLDPTSLVAPGQRIVVVAPHPDDELLGAGGVLAQLPADCPILIVAVTDGDGSHPGSATWTPERLRAERPLESEKALQALGITAHFERLGIPDGGVAKAQERVADSLATLLTSRDVVLATWRGDGHPDHEAVGRAVETACSAVGSVRWEMPIWTWHWAQPGDSRVPWEAAVRCELPAEIRRRKQEAVQCYRSQLEEDPVTDLGCILPQQILDRLLRTYEVLFRA